MEVVGLEVECNDLGACIEGGYWIVVAGVDPGSCWIDASEVVSMEGEE